MREREEGVCECVRERGFGTSVLLRVRDVSSCWRNSANACVQEYQATPKVIRESTRNISGSGGWFSSVLRRRGWNLPPRTQPAHGAV